MKDDMLCRKRPPQSIGLAMVASASQGAWAQAAASRASGWSDPVRPDAALLDLARQALHPEHRYGEARDEYHRIKARISAACAKTNFATVGLPASGCENGSHGSFGLRAMS